MSKRAVIVGAAPGIVPLERLNLVQGRDVVICADGGRNTLEKLGVIPDWYVGDNDSGGYPDGLPAMLLPPEKDVSDLEMAVDKALELGCDELILTGCTGGRLDHELANLGLLEQIENRGAKGMMLDPENEVRFFRPGSYLIPNDPCYHYLGMIALDECISNLTLKGVKYPLDNFLLRRGTTRTISNEMAGQGPAELSFRSGRLMLIRSEHRNV